ncbi:hypothetical protein CHARACLAT_009730 [Characodon lateralis]|uniref:Uncharacterized protein n=1 Tax=Characodon lateralis TaxID=208331 RepID=A0ABU7E3A4_9TELE|nr:hypothetical protein [Characodon lateralis]
MESRGAACLRVDRVRSEEAKVMKSGCCQRSLMEYPNSNSWHKKAKAASPIAGGVTLGATQAPHNAVAAVWLLLGLVLLLLREPDRRIPFTP